MCTHTHTTMDSRHKWIYNPGHRNLLLALFRGASVTACAARTQYTANATSNTHFLQRTLCDVDDEEHHVDDVHAADDGADE